MTDTPPTLTDAVRQILEDAFPEYRVDQGNTNTQIAQDYVLRQIMPLLEAADGLRALCRGEMGECCDVDSYDQARATIIEGAR